MEKVLNHWIGEEAMTLDRAADGAPALSSLLPPAAVSSEFVSKTALTSKQGKVRLPSYLPIFNY